MKKLDTNITMEEIQAIIVEENQKAEKEKNYEPANSLVLLSEGNLMLIERHENLDKFRKKNQEKIYELETKIHDLYEENGFEYLVNFESSHLCDSFLSQFIEDGLSFEQLLEKAKEVMDEFGHKVYTLKAIYDEIDNIL